MVQIVLRVQSSRKTNSLIWLYYHWFMPSTRTSVISLYDIWILLLKISFRITWQLLCVGFFFNSKLVEVLDGLFDWLHLFFGFHFEVTGSWETLPTYICLFILLGNMTEPVWFSSVSPRVLINTLFFLFKGSLWG